MQKNNFSKDFTIPSKSFQDIMGYEGNYPEDYRFENGNYENQCIKCENHFIGYKRRVICKVCNTSNSVNDENKESPLQKILSKVNNSETPLSEW